MHCLYVFRFAIFFVNASLFSLNMRTSVFLVFCCLVMFLLCGLYLFSGIVNYVFKFFPLDIANKAYSQAGHP